MPWVYHLRCLTVAFVIAPHWYWLEPDDRASFETASALHDLLGVSLWISLPFSRQENLWRLFQNTLVTHDSGWGCLSTASRGFSTDIGMFYPITRLCWCRGTSESLMPLALWGEMLMSQCHSQIYPKASGGAPHHGLFLELVPPQNPHLQAFLVSCSWGLYSVHGKTGTYISFHYYQTYVDSTDVQSSILQNIL